MATDEPESEANEGVEPSGGEVSGASTRDGSTDDEVSDETTGAGVSEELDRTRARLEEGAERAVDEFDQGIVDLLAWLLDTETRARIYVHLRQKPDSTSQEVADGTGLYPSTVREALSELHEEGTVTREKRENAGAGNNPYEYRAIPPSELVQQAVGDIQSELNAVFNLDERLGTSSGSQTEPVTITVEGEGDPQNSTEVDVETEENESVDDEESELTGDEETESAE